MTTIGINLLVYMKELEGGTPQSALLPVIAGHGVGLAEVRREYIGDDAEYDRIAAAGRDNGLTLFYSVPEPLVVGDGMNRDCGTYLDEAVRMGAKNVKFNQGDVKDATDDVIAAIDAAVAERGLTVSIENDQTPANGTLTCTAASLARIREAGGAIGYTFDLGNWFWRGENAASAFDRLLPYVTVFHLKNVNGAPERGALRTTMLDDGVIDWRSMLPRLGADVPVLLEFPIPADRVAGQLDAVRGVVD